MFRFISSSFSEQRIFSFCGSTKNTQPSFNLKIVKHYFSLTPHHYQFICNHQNQSPPALPRKITISINQQHTKRYPVENNDTINSNCVYYRLLFDSKLYATIFLLFSIFYFLFLPFLQE